MTTNSRLELPGNTCAYEQYDPQTLEPLNDQTYLRLQELGWDEGTFRGRSVLDIGCNSGLLTTYVLRLGASKVHACDVQSGFVEFVRKVVELRKLPVTVSQLPFDKLSPEQHRADVVLFMEVLHWAVSQGLKLRDVISRLADLTNETLYIEFPWAVTEPSIQRQTKLTKELYSADAALDELTRYFQSVRVVRFMHYFGYETESKRVLVEATQKRAVTPVLARAPGVYSLDVALTRNHNQSYLLASAKGSLVAKRLAPESLLNRIPEKLLNALFDELNALNPKTLLPPARLNGSYCFSDQSTRWLVFPFVGPLPAAGRPRPPTADTDELLEIFVKVRRDLRVPLELLEDLRRNKFFPLTFTIQNLKQYLADLNTSDVFTKNVADALRDLDGLDAAAFDALCHGDLQRGNIVNSDSLRIRVVDLDNLCLAPLYSDGLLGLIWRGAVAENMARFCELLAHEEDRAVLRSDVTYAIARGISWFAAVRSRDKEPIIGEQIARLKAGVDEALIFRKKLEPRSSP